MNHREPSHPSGRVSKALRCLSLLLLPATAPEGLHALPHRSLPFTGSARRGAEPTPYLPITGAPPLRFQEASPPPDLVARPPAAAPPMPALTPTESSVALANAAAARSATVSTEPLPATTPGVESPASKDTPTAPAKTPAPILRDDARPAIRPEDFLPYFQIPGSAQNPADVTLFVPAPKNAPAPAPLPPSSATYRQTPK
jgi:hypothetical protein